MCQSKMKIIIIIIIIPKINHNGKSGTSFNVVNEWGGLRCHIGCHIAGQSHSSLDKKIIDSTMEPRCLGFYDCPPS